MFQAAHGGTLFLDEIADLPLPMQVKLLRAIQESPVRPVGPTQEARSTCASSAPPTRTWRADVQAGRFRQDLYYRINVIELRVPPLRERREDLPVLCEARAGAHRARGRRMPPPALSPARRCEQLQAHPLPGNVRELENLLHRALALSDGERAAGGLRAVTTALPRCADGAPARRGRAARRRAARCRAVPDDLQAYLDQQEREILVQGAERNQLQPHRRGAAPGPVAAPDPLPHRAPGDRHARQRRGR